MKRLSLFVCLSFLFTFFTQHSEAQLRAQTNGKPLVLAGHAATSTGYSGTGSNINVTYHRIQWTIDPDVATVNSTGGTTTTITGTVTTYFKTIQAAVNKIRFDLSGNYTFSAKYHGSAITTSRPSTNVIELTLPVTLAINTLDSVVVSYTGAPPTFADYGEGVDRANFTTTGNVIYTLAESYGDDDFWPCKADMQDKVDSALDVIITVPSAFMAATNGVLVSNVVSGANRILTYQHRYPIASYLVCVAVARYNVFNRGTVNINGTLMPVEYYIYTGRGASPTTQLNAMDFCKLELVEFSNKYGDYPFKSEKYGMYEFGWGGGMEHQTFSAMSFGSMSSWSTIAHELAHQWFGDKVTFATWNHLWLAEGFATYSQVLAAELVPSLGQNPVTHRTSLQTTALSTSTTPIYLSNANIANSNVIWTTANDNAVYKRGAMVVSMLRKLAGDTKFFQALKNYLADPALAYKSATTDDLKNHFEAVLGYDLDPFFNDFIYGTGNPVYTIRWNNTGTRVAIKVVSQTRSASSTVTYFRAPVVVKISNGTSSVTRVIYDQNGKLSFAGNGISAPVTTNTLSFDLPFTPTTVTYDADDETLSTGTATKDATINPLIYTVLPINIIDFKGVKTNSGAALSLLLAQTHEATSVTAERSEDGISFTTIGAMLKGSVSENGTLYTLEDKTFSNAHINYYRAKTIDEEGTVQYSKIISLQNRSETRDGVSIRPNTVMNVLKIFLSEGWEQTPVSFIVYNSSGMVVKTETGAAAAAMQLQVKNLPAGNYTLKAVRPDGQTTAKRFIIVH